VSSSRPPQLLRNFGERERLVQGCTRIRLWWLIRQDTEVLVEVSRHEPLALSHHCHQTIPGSHGHAVNGHLTLESCTAANEKRGESLGVCSDIAQNGQRVPCPELQIDGYRSWQAVTAGEHHTTEAQRASHQPLGWSGLGALGVIARTSPGHSAERGDKHQRGRDPASL